MRRLRLPARALALGSALVLAVVLSACGGGGQPAAAPVGAGGGGQKVSVAGRQLAAYKRTSGIPACPKVARRGVAGGMPSVTLPCLGGGRSVDVAGLRGPMIVNLWAVWCGVCQREMPALASYAAKQKAVKVLGIDYLDPQPGAALVLAKRSHVGYPLVADTQGALDRASPLPSLSGLPISVFLDAHGRITHIDASPMLTERDVATAASTYLGVRR